jgi:peptidoglycan/xylan/chitin deacetylase (PgdA/CDA1 family)
MPPADSAYYHSLRPLAALFETGLPVLTYHKLGPRPAGARLKGLYLSQRLFAKQLAELCQAGFVPSKLSALSNSRSAGSAPNRRVAITFDDGFRNVLEFGAPLLKEHKFSAIQFLVAAKVGGQNDWEIADGEVPAPLMNDTQVREWLAAGHEIGSHTLTHPWLTRLPAPRAREEITASRKLLQDRFGVSIEHFCYPYGDWNESIRDLVAAAGYKTACTTQPGINAPTDSPFSLKRFTARYPSRNLKAIWRRLLRA